MSSKKDSQKKKVTKKSDDFFEAFKVGEDEIRTNEESQLKFYEMWAMKHIHNQIPESFENFSIWKTPKLLDYRNQEREIILAMNDSSNLVDLKDQPCGCGSTKFSVAIKQLRGADEGASTIYTCLNCNKTRRVNA